MFSLRESYKKTADLTVREQNSHMPILSEYSRRKKIDYFLRMIPKNARILEIGCGSSWVGQYLKQKGCNQYMGLDLVSPADIVGSIKNWQNLELKAGTFDYIVAFEVVEHVDCFQECYDLLKSGGRLLITTPVPKMDPVLQLLESLGLNQKRTSSHDHLVELHRVIPFEKKDIKIIAFLSQWAIFEKAG